MSKGVNTTVDEPLIIGSTATDLYNGALDGDVTQTLCGNGNYKSIPHVLEDGPDTHTHTHTHTVSTLQGGGKRGYRIDAESAAGGHLIVGGGRIDR